MLNSILEYTKTGRYIASVTLVRRRQGIAEAAFPLRKGKKGADVGLSAAQKMQQIEDEYSCL
jgi:hypothetical protein